MGFQFWANYRDTGSSKLCQETESTLAEKHGICFVVASSGGISIKFQLAPPSKKLKSSSHPLSLLSSSPVTSIGGGAGLMQHMFTGPVGLPLHPSLSLSLSSKRLGEKFSKKKGHVQFRSINPAFVPLHRR